MNESTWSQRMSVMTRKRSPSTFLTATLPCTRRPSGSGPRAIRNVQSSAKNDMIRSTSRLLKASLICFMSAGVGPVVIVISPRSPRRLVRRSQQADLFHERDCIPIIRLPADLPDSSSRMLGPRTDEKHLPVAGTGAGSELAPLADRSSLDGHDHLRARADMRGELVPATHGAELWGSDGVRAVELVDRRVDPPRRPFRFAGRSLRHLSRGYIAPAAPHSRASQRVRQVNRVIPPIPFALDRGVDLGNHNQQALGELGHLRSPSGVVAWASRPSNDGARGTRTSYFTADRSATKGDVHPPPPRKSLAQANVVDCRA